MVAWDSSPSFTDKIYILNGDHQWKNYLYIYHIYHSFRKKSPFESIPPRSLTYPLKMDHPNRKVVFQPPFFRGYVKLPGCILNFLTKHRRTRKSKVDGGSPILLSLARLGKKNDINVFWVRKSRASIYGKFIWKSKYCDHYDMDFWVPFILINWDIMITSDRYLRFIPLNTGLLGPNLSIGIPGGVASKMHHEILGSWETWRAEIRQTSWASQVVVWDFSHQQDVL